MNGRADRWPAVSGLAFVALFIAALIIPGDQLGSVGDPDRRFVSYFGDASNRVRDIAGAYVLTAAGLAFVVFLSHLYTRLAANTGGRVLPLVALVSGVIFAALCLAAAAALSAVSSSIAFADLLDEEPHTFGADVSRLATQLGFLLLVFAMLAASLSIAAISLAARLQGMFPGWLVWLGLVAATVLLFSFFFLPAAALPIWALATSLYLLRTSGTTARHPLTPLP